MTQPQTTPETLKDDALSRLLEKQWREEPPAGIDAAILAAAHAATTPAAPRKAPWWRRLQAPIALTASALFAVVLTLTMERAPELSQSPPTETESRSDRTAAPQAAAAEAEPRAAAKSAAPRREPEPFVADTPRAVPSPAAPQADAAQSPPPPVLEQAMPRQRPPAEKSESIERKAKSDQAEQGVVSGNAAGPAMNSVEAAPAASSRRKEFAAPSLADQNEAAATATGSTPAAAPVGRLQATPKLQKPMVPEARSAEAPQLPAAEWITHIRELRQQGRTLEADYQLKALRKAYPDYVLPEDLR